MKRIAIESEEPLETILSEGHEPALVLKGREPGQHLRVSRYAGEDTASWWRRACGKWRNLFPEAGPAKVFVYYHADRRLFRRPLETERVCGEEEA